MSSRRNRILAASIGSLLSVGLAVPAFAQSTTATTTTATTASATQKTRPTAAQMQADRAARDAEFAARLGVTVAQITQANKDQAKADVDKALAAGTINAAQASAYKTLIDNSTDGRDGFRLPRGTASTTQPTQAERDAAQAARLKEYVARLGVSVEAYTKAVKDQAKADIDKDVAAGRLTAAEATTRKAQIDASTTIGGPGFGGPGGGKGGHGGPGMGGQGQGGRGMGGPAAAGTSASSTTGAVKQA